MPALQEIAYVMCDASKQLSYVTPQARADCVANGKLAMLIPREQDSRRWISSSWLPESVGAGVEVHADAVFGA